MNHNIKRVLPYTLCVLLMIVFDGHIVNAQGELGHNGSVKVEVSDKTPPVDPENPDKPTDTDTDYSTSGDLRIDFVSPLNFGANKITKTNRKYAALAQQFDGKLDARANYIQITNQQESKSGWSLQVKQNRQFTSVTKDKYLKEELKGAILSLDKGWANSISESRPPTVTRETIAINEMEMAYEVASAKPNEARGTWLISFGASDKNTKNQSPTLSPVVDENNNQLIDAKTKKPLIRNSAVTLTVPDSTNIQPVSYETELTWVLGRLP
ncbi:WxL domain-containing protein [Vagococcus bubulae]|uniref:WxL domain-containing protein n=1 Tax=Vagococcus bubulae TaxID=1977868 RepID=UPI0022E6A888|nr:WxL domain-containing protein [Vagococcus bubulae]